MAPPVTEPVTAAIAPFLAGTNLAIGSDTVQLGLLNAVYGPRRNAPLWVDSTGQPTPTALEAVALIGKADAEGLHPAAYHQAALAALSQPHSPQESATFDLLLSDGMAMYLHDLRVGRTPIGPQRDASFNEPYDVPAGLLTAAAASPTDLDTLIAGLDPTLPDYAALKAALADLRQQADWPALPPGGSLKPGMTGPDIAALRTRLHVDPGKKPQFYDETLAGAVKAFQETHAIKDDGAVGKETRQALDMPRSSRIDEVIAAMERLRWLQRDLGPRHVLVDVSGFWVRLVDNDQTTMQLPVIVGTDERETPQLQSQIDTVVINPTWTVPPTIIKEDLLPKLESNPGYLAKRHIELFRKGDDGLEPASASELSHGNWSQFVFRQPAGEENPLGRYKLLFKNPYSIYLHDTPEKQKFSAALRTFSSGCVRVEDVRKLVDALLTGVRTDEQIDAALATKETKSIHLPTPVPIYIFYASVWLGPQGQLIYGPDLYQKDGELAGSL
jgi:murein L,D-transpeptidase YcbB/YkuD